MAIGMEEEEEEEGFGDLAWRRRLFLKWDYCIE